MLQAAAHDGQVAMQLDGFVCGPGPRFQCVLAELAKRRLIDILPGTSTQPDAVLLRADLILNSGSSGGSNDAGAGRAAPMGRSGQVAGSTEGERGGKQHSGRERADRKRSRSRSRSRSREHGRRVPSLSAGTPAAHAAVHADNQQQELLVPVLVRAVSPNTESSWKLIGRNVLVRGMGPRTTQAQIQAVFEGKGSEGEKAGTAATSNRRLKILWLLCMSMHEPRTPQLCNEAVLLRACGAQ
jgi:hypothetical protein